MADVIYKKGQSANLDNVEIADGQILVTEDTGEMYIDMSDGTRKKISDKEATDKIATLDTKINTLVSTKLTRQIVEALPPVEEGSETTIYMVGPKDDNTYDEYMKVPNGMVCESVTNVGNRYNIQPSLTSFEQENGYYIIPDMTCNSVTGGVGQFNGTAASVAFGFNSNEEGERFAQFCQPNEIYTLKIKVDSSTSSMPNITEIKACQIGPAYELIGNTSVDLSTKQDKFAEYDLAHNTWVPADTFQLGSNDKSYLSLNTNVATIRGKTNAQLSIERGTIGLTELTQNNESILTLAMNGAAGKRRITGVTDVENDFDVANKQYVDNEIVKSKYEILQTAIAGTDIIQTNGPMISGIYTVTTISNRVIGVKDPNGNSWTLNVQNTNLNFSRNDQLLITTRTGAITGEIITIKEIKKQDKLQLIKEHIKHNTVELTGSIKTIEQRTQSNCVYVGGSSGISTDTEYTVVNISPSSATSVTIYINQSGASFNFKYSGMLEMGIGDTFTLEKVDGTTGTLVMNDKFNIHINHKITQSTDVTILGVKTPTAESSNTVAANKEYVDSRIVVSETAPTNPVEGQIWICPME